MEFSFDISQTPLIGRRILLKSDTNVGPVRAAHNNALVASSAMQHDTHASTAVASTVGPLGSPRRSASLSPADAVQLSGWKRPWMSQGRVRECLVSLLTTCGQRVGLPKSPSVSVGQRMAFVCEWMPLCFACEYIIVFNCFYLKPYINIYQFP